MSQTFHKLLNPNCLLAIDTTRRRVAFTEDSNKTTDTLQSITMEDLPENSFVFCLDKEVPYRFKDKSLTQKPKNYFLNIADSHINDIADGLIIHYVQNHIYVFIVEMKSLSKNGFGIQLINTKLLIEYIFRLYQVFEKSGDTLQIQLVLFHYERPITKQKKGFGKEKRGFFTKKIIQGYSETYISCPLYEPMGFIHWNEFFQ